jgi:hypothetical protein
MLTFKQGNLFDDDAEALVNPVNCVGVSGAGLAKKFVRRFPEAERAWDAATAAHAERCAGEVEAAEKLAEAWERKYEQLYNASRNLCALADAMLPGQMMSPDQANNAQRIVTEMAAALDFRAEALSATRASVEKTEPKKEKE